MNDTESFSSLKYSEFPHSEKLEKMGAQEETNVIVAVRVRPQSEDERTRGENGTIFCPDQRHLLVCHEGHERAFAFDVVLGPQSSQQDVFEECGVKRLIEMAIKGYACTVFAFGQTGSGKSYTITGPHSLFLGGQQDSRMYGLLQRSLSYLLDQTHSMEEEFSFWVSYLEIYNEQVRDLLNPWLSYSLSVCGSQTHGFYVKNVSIVEFCSLDDFLKLLEGGMQNRHTASQPQNEHSSRSHCILTLYIKGEPAGMGGGAAIQGKLCIVDLAGSEKVKDASSSNVLLEETGNINRSLLTLGKCISALVDTKRRSGHIPYRDSKLTKLLSDSLGGSGITLMIACVSPTAANFQETMNTLRYSSRAKRIKNRPMAKQELREKLVTSLQREISLLRRENTLLRRHLSLSEGNIKKLILPHNADANSESFMKAEMDPVRSGSSSSLVSLRSLVQELKCENDRLQQDKVELLNSIESSRQQGELLSLENSRMLRGLKDLERIVSTSLNRNSICSGLSLGHHCTHHQLPLPVIALDCRCPDLLEPCYTRPHLPVIHHCGFHRGGASKVQHELQWNVKTSTLPNDAPVCQPLQACGPEQNRQAEALPPLQAPPPENQAIRPVQSSLVAENQNLKFSGAPDLHQRRKSEADYSRCVQRFRKTSSSWTQQDQPRRSRSQVVPSAPPMSALPPIEPDNFSMKLKRDRR